MEKIILIYCSLIGVIIAAMFCLLLLDSTKPASDKNILLVTDKGLAIGTALLVVLLAHLNWLLLPPETQAALFPAIATGGLLAFLLLIVGIRWFYIQQNNSDGKVITWYRSDGKPVSWRVYLNNSAMAAAAHTVPDDIMAG